MRGVVIALVWQQAEDWMAAATITRYQAWLGENRGLQVGSYEELWRWSVSDLPAFWQSIVDFCQVRFSVEPSAVLGRASMPGAEWLPDARVSYAEHIFRDRPDDGPALFFASELRRVDSWTWGELRAQVGAI